MTAAPSRRFSRLRLIGNFAIGLGVLIAGVWWSVATCASAQEQRRLAVVEFGRLQNFIDQRWSTLKVLSAVYEETRPNKIVNPFDVGNGPRHPLYAPGTPEYTFDEHQKWTRPCPVDERIARVRSIEGCMSEFLRSLEADAAMSTNVLVSAFHRDLAISQNELPERIAAYNTVALVYNAKLQRFPGSMLLKQFDLKPVPVF